MAEQKYNTAPQGSPSAVSEEEVRGFPAPMLKSGPGLQHPSYSM